MYKIVKFLPQNFGGYSLSLILSGLFLGYTTSKQWYFVIASIFMYFFAMYFYVKDNYEEK